MVIVNKWLDHLPTWQFALVWASCLVLGFVVAGCVDQLVAGHLNLSFIVGYGVVSTVLSTSAGTWSRRRRHLRPSGLEVDRVQQPRKASGQGRSEITANAEPPGETTPTSGPTR
jgi:hypothetical protein